MSKSNKIHQPDTNEYSNKVLSNKVDTQKIQSEKNPTCCHKFLIHKLINHISSKKSRQTVHNSTKMFKKL